MCTLLQGERGLPGLPGDAVSPEIEPVFKVIFTVQYINPGPLHHVPAGPTGLFPSIKACYTGLIGYSSECVWLFFSECPVMNLGLFQCNYCGTALVIRFLFLKCCYRE